MQTNHLDSATSPTCVRDGHHSSRRDALVCGAPGGEHKGQPNGDGVRHRAEIKSEEEMQGSGCAEAAENATGDAKHVARRCGRAAAQDSDGRNGTSAMPVCAASDDGSSARVEATQRSTREALPLRSWPDARSFDWETPCVEKVTGSVARVGQAAGRSQRRGERRRGDRTSRDAAHKERIEKKRALTALIERGGKQTGHVLQGTAFALGNEEREEWMEKLVEYLAVHRDEKREMAKKKPRIETGLNGEVKIVKMNGDAEHSVEESKHRVEKRRAMTDSFELRDLIDAGVVKTGEGVVDFAHGGIDYTADLTAEGQIRFCGHTFASPNDFARFIERRTTPFADRDDAWKRVVVSGRSLADWRMTQISESTNTLKSKKVSID